MEYFLAHKAWLKEMNKIGILTFNHDHSILLNVSYSIKFCQKKCQIITVEVKYN